MSLRCSAQRPVLGGGTKGHGSLRVCQRNPALSLWQAIYKLKKACRAELDLEHQGQLLTPEEVVDRIFLLVDENGDGKRDAVCRETALSVRYASQKSPTPTTTSLLLIHMSVNRLEKDGMNSKGAKTQAHTFVRALPRLAGEGWASK